MRTPKVQTPPVLSDLYRDLKDRRLLPVVAALLVAIVAVPVAISASSGEPATVSGPAAEIVPADAAEAQAAVLAENPGLRNYRRRLDALKASNPFEQQFQVPEAAETAVEGLAESAGIAAGSEAAPTDTGSTGTGSTGTGSVDLGVGGSPPDTSGAPPAGVTEPDTGTATTESKTRFYTFRVDVRYGAEGAVEEHRNVKLLDFLSPVGVFLGVSEDGKKALFFLSSDVLSAVGDGECAPAPTDCEFLALGKGQVEQIQYQPPDGSPAVTYSLELAKVKIVERKKPPAPR
jgi:hypothetical protein